MNKNKLKSYAPAARKAFIQAVTDRAHFWGLSEKGTMPIEEKGDVVIIGGRPFPRKLAGGRKVLEDRIRRDGFNQVMEAVAYTWFNRFMALRYMEIHGYLEHGFCVLSHPNGGPIPEILEQATNLDLPGLDKQQVLEWKLEGTKDSELYRNLLVAQCNALSAAMPFLFERINDETELLLPDNLLHSDSLIRKLVSEIDEEDWREVEIIGWLYQFYISEKKDEVIGKVVKSEDIPAATQLFTPKWIVQYMVQNSLGRMWLATYPALPLRDKMEYYIEPAQQTEEVNAQLKAITPATLNPELITFLDPASGSGHILVEAYDIFKAIYLERGYSKRDFPRLILEKNLYGLDIDDRAAQMTSFALLMKARKDDRRILQNGNTPKLNVMSIQETKDLNARDIATALLHPRPQGEGRGEGETISRQNIIDLIELFQHGKTLGSLITIPDLLAEKIPALTEIINDKLQGDDMFARRDAEAMLPIMQQTKLLAREYDCVVTNPPYMGNKGMNNQLKEFALSACPDYRADLFAIFIERILRFARKFGLIGLMTPFTWLYLQSFEHLRKEFIVSRTLTSLIEPEYHAFFDSAFVPICTFTLTNGYIPSYTGSFIKLTDFYGYEAQNEKTLEAIRNKNCYWFMNSQPDDFKSIPGMPISYWVSDKIISVFRYVKPISEIIISVKGLDTCDNNTYVRRWSEVSRSNTLLTSESREDACLSGLRWFPYSKGGNYRKWYGNNEYVVDWANDGDILRNLRDDAGKIKSRPQSMQHYFKEGITFGAITSADFSGRYMNHAIFGGGGNAVFSQKLIIVLGLLNSKLVTTFSKILNPTLNMLVGDILRIPYVENSEKEQNLINIVNHLIRIAKSDWDSFETSWDFQSFPWLTSPLKTETVSESWQNWQAHCTDQIKRMQELETENNRLFIEAYGLQDELTPDVPEDQITLARADQETDMKRLISYAIGCMMGRYSIDQPGLVYAHSGNAGFDHTKYKSFPADDDGIVPIMDMDWFEDDAARRLEKFIQVAWPPETLEENLKFVADSLSPKSGETPRETIRRYISTQFFKDHLQTYKKRPIYWLFSSGKQRAFECLVYLHRYNEATLSRMRNEYVTPLQGKFAARADFLTGEIDAAASTSARNKLQKQLDTLKKKQVELAAFDDLLRHYSDLRISLDLDDGVKVNYGKFGNLLAEVKTVTGTSE